MAKLYTADELIELIRDSGMLPDTASTGTADADLLAHLNHSMLTELVPRVLQFREEYLVVTEEVPLTASESHYRIPHRALGSRLRDLYWTDGTSSRYLDHLARKDVPYFGTASSNQPTGFYLEGNHVVLFPSVSSASGSLRLSYFFRPGELVLLENTRKVASVDSATSVTVDSTVPTAWTTASTFDVHSRHSGGEIKVWDLAATTVSGTSLTFTTSIDGSVFGTHPVEVGDYVCLAETAALPALPRELHPTLGQAALCRVLLALGDHENLQIQVSKLNRMTEDAKYLLNSRVDGKPKIINNRNSLFNATRGHSQQQDSFGWYR